MNETKYFTQEYEEDGDMIVEKEIEKLALDIAQLEMIVETQDSRIDHANERIADLQAQLERQTNRASKWRKRAAYYKLRESRCMGEANYTSVERVDDLERQRDDLAAALRWLVYLCHDIGKAGDKPQPGEWEAAAHEGMDALAQLKGDKRE